jgi:hypothetical protein
MHDLFEILARGRIGEHDRAELLTIHLARGRDDRLAEAADNGREARRVRRNDLVRERIAVDGGNAELLELVLA